jgi:ParB-like chromosome segregation protein Spo0J
MKVEDVLIDLLRFDEHNARIHSKKNLKAIEGSLKTFGQRKPIVVWGDVVVAGNGTLQAAISLDWEYISVVRCPVNWTYEQARAYSLADNRTAELADWDADLLANHLIDLDAVGFEVGDWGFETLVPPLDPEPEEERTPKVVTCPDCGLEFIPNK